MPHATDHGFITEDDVIARWPMVPATAIRRARRGGEIKFFQFPSGPHYKILDVEEFIDRKYRRGPLSGAEFKIKPDPNAIPKLPSLPSVAEREPSMPIVGEQETPQQETDRIVAETYFDRIQARRDASRAEKATLKKTGRPREGA